MRFTETGRRQVVALDTAKKVGRVEGFVVSPGDATVATLLCGKTPGEGTLLDWSDLKAFGADAVTVPSADVFRTPHGQREELAVKGRLEVVGRRVLTERGDGLGEIVDVDFDPETGRVRALLTNREEVDGERLLGVGTYAVVVSAPPR